MVERNIQDVQSMLEKALLLGGVCELTEYKLNELRVLHSGDGIVELEFGYPEDGIRRFRIRIVCEEVSPERRLDLTNEQGAGAKRRAEYDIVSDYDGMVVMSGEVMFWNYMPGTNALGPTLSDDRRRVKQHIRERVAADVWPRLPEGYGFTVYLHNEDAGE